MRCLLRIIMSGILAAAIAAAAHSACATTPEYEYKVKVAYLYNFIRYFSWPEEAFTSRDAPFVIGVLGKAPFGTALDELATRKRAQGRPIVVVRSESLDDFQPCHILFVTRTTDVRVKNEAAGLRRQDAVLIVGEAQGFAQQGAGANFYLDVDGTIGFEINVDVITERRLGADARLLKLAKIVRNP